MSPLRVVLYGNTVSPLLSLSLRVRFLHCFPATASLLSYVSALFSVSCRVALALPSITLHVSDLFLLQAGHTHKQCLLCLLLLLFLRLVCFLFHYLILLLFLFLLLLQFVLWRPGFLLHCCLPLFILFLQTWSLPSFPLAFVTLTLCYRHALLLFHWLQLTPSHSLMFICFCLLVCFLLCVWHCLLLFLFHSFTCFCTTLLCYCFCLFLYTALFFCSLWTLCSSSLAPVTLTSIACSTCLSFLLFMCGYQASSASAALVYFLSFSVAISWLSFITHLCLLALRGYPFIHWLRRSSSSLLPFSCNLSAFSSFFFRVRL